MSQTSILMENIEMTEVAPNSQQQHIINKNHCYQLSNGSFDRDR